MKLPRLQLSQLRALWFAVLVAFLVRAASYAGMTALALWNELQSAPTLPDRILQHVPYVPSIARLNYLVWLLFYLPLSATLLLTEPKRWIRYMHTGSLLSLLRGVCIVLTGLGTPDPSHNPSGIFQRRYLDIYLDLLSPLGVFQRNALHSYLTKDLFFSGHTATTFVLFLYLSHRPVLRVIALFAHFFVVMTVFVSHIHYSIDVVGAWAITFAVFALREWRPASAVLGQTSQ